MFKVLSMSVILLHITNIKIINYNISNKTGVIYHFYINYIHNRWNMKTLYISITKSKS